MDPDQEQLKTMLIKAFDMVSEGYDGTALRFFPESSRHIVELLGLSGRERMLDIATGTGHAALALAAAFPQGYATGVDFSPGMLAQARQKAESLGIRNVEFLERDMRDLDFPKNHFDAAICSFGIFFVDEMDEQLTRIVSVVKPGGRIAITTFTEDSFQPLADLMHNRIQHFGVKETDQARTQLTTENDCRNLFKGAGIENIAIETRDQGYFLKDASEWWQVVWNAGYRRLMNQLSAKDLEQFKREHLQEVKELQTPDGIWLNIGVIYTTGTKP